MLTIFEKILFLAALGASGYFGYLGFRRVYQIVMRGPGEKPTLKEITTKLWDAAVTWISTRPIWKTRTASSIFHFMVSIGFVFYFLVNFGDILEGLFPITFLGEGNGISEIYLSLIHI